MKRQVPGRVPWILPLVGDRDDVVVQHVEPLGIPDLAVSSAGQRVGLMLLQPLVQIEVVVLLAPEHASQGLAVYTPLIRAQRTRSDSLVELICIGEASSKYLVKSFEWVRR